MNTSSMLRKPGWAKQLRRNKREEDIPDQITIIKKGDQGIPQPLSSQQMKMEMDEGSRYTGAGQDRLMQPGKVAGDVHEGEMVLSANATQAFPADVRQALTEQAEAGTIDIPAIRKALKLNPQQGYDLGSFGNPVKNIFQPIPKFASTIEPPKIANQITAPAPVIHAITPPPPAPDVAEPIQVAQPVTEVKAPPPTPEIQTITPPPPAPTPPPAPAQPSAYTTGFNASLNRLQDVAGGNSQIDRNIANRNLRLYDTGAATDIAVADQQATLQNNIPESARAALGAEARSSVRSGRSELIGGLAQSEQERALGANQAAASLAMQGMQFEEDKNLYQNAEGWTAYDKAIAAGSFDTAAARYKAITGKDISMDQMKTYQNYLNTKQQQDIRTGELSITSLTTRVGDEQVSAISEAIGKGMSLSQINAQYPNAKLTTEDFKAMYEATPLGERTWERNMSYAKTLLEAGGAQNITAAAGIFNQLFPGTNIDFSKIITADNAATVNQGMSQLSDLVAAGMNYEEAIKVMDANGTLKMLGMTPADVEKVYRGMKVNAIDEQWRTISESDFYKNLSPEKQTDMKTFFTAVLSGELDYSIQKEYTVIAKDETKSTMYFNSAADANAYGVSHNATMVATGKSKVTPRTSVLDEPPDGNTPPPKKRTEPLGTIIVENGKIYQVIADGNTQEIVPDVDDLWSDNNQKILKAGEKDNPYYTTIINKMYSEVTNGKDIFDGLNTDRYWKNGSFYIGEFMSDLMSYTDKLKNDERIGSLSYDDPVIQKLKEQVEKESKALLNKTSTPGRYITIVKDGNTWKYEMGK